MYAIYRQTPKKKHWSTVYGFNFWFCKENSEHISNLDVGQVYVFLYQTKIHSGEWSLFLKKRILQIDLMGSFSYNIILMHIRYFKSTSKRYGNFSGQINFCSWVSYTRLFNRLYSFKLQREGWLPIKMRLWKHTCSQDSQIHACQAKSSA